MIQAMLNRPLLVSALLLAPLLILNGCATGPGARDEVSIDAPRADMDRAAELKRQGDFDAASRLYRQMAERADSPSRESLLLLAADALLQDKQPGAADEILQTLNQQPITSMQTLWLRILKGESQLLQGHSRQALTYLLPAPPSDAPRVLQIQGLKNLANAHRLEGNLVESARARADLDPLLDEAKRLDNQVALLRTLTALRPAALQQAAARTSGAYQGWVELALTLQGQRESSPELDAELGQWRKRHRGHPARSNLVSTYLTGTAAEMGAIASIGVLLPASGRFADAAGAVREGFLAAYYQSPVRQQPVVRFYDSSNPGDVPTLYRRAVAEGADVVIGPLQKQSVDQLIRAPALDTPVLALNRASVELPPSLNLYQFALAPEDEAAQIAERIWSDGYGDALVLVPQGSWGRRMASAFRERLQALGGRVVGEQSYQPGQHDFSGPIQQLLRLRGDEDGRRQDADCIFLVAKAEKAREIWPQLQFYYAGDLKIYTGSQIYDGSFSSQWDVDLVGLTFPGAPWLLREDPSDPLARSSLASLLPGVKGPYSSLYAMGIDSYALAFRLGWLRADPSARLEGKTGILYLDPLQRVQRELIWARMGSAGPQVIDFLPGPALASPQEAAGAAAEISPLYDVRPQ